MFVVTRAATELTLLHTRGARRSAEEIAADEKDCELMARDDWKRRLTDELNKRRAEKDVASQRAKPDVEAAREYLAELRESVQKDLNFINANAGGRLGLQISNIRNDFFTVKSDQAVEGLHVSVTPDGQNVIVRPDKDLVTGEETHRFQLQRTPSGSVAPQLDRMAQAEGLVQIIVERFVRSYLL